MLQRELNLKYLARFQNKMMFLVGFISLYLIFKESTASMPPILTGSVLETLFVKSRFSEISFAVSSGLFVAFLVWFVDIYLQKAIKLRRRKVHIQQWASSLYESARCIHYRLMEFCLDKDYDEIVFFGSSRSKTSLELNSHQWSKPINATEIRSEIQAITEISKDFRNSEDVFDDETCILVDKLYRQCKDSNSSLYTTEEFKSHRQFVLARDVLHSVIALLQNPLLHQSWKGSPVHGFEKKIISHNKSKKIASAIFLVP